VGGSLQLSMRFEEYREPRCPAADWRARLLSQKAQFRSWRFTHIIDEPGFWTSGPPFAVRPWIRLRQNVSPKMAGTP